MMMPRSHLLSSSLVAKSIFAFQGQTVHFSLKKSLAVPHGQFHVRLAQTSSSASQVASPHLEALGTSGHHKDEKSAAHRLDFSSHSFAFRHKKTSELLRGYIILRACAVDTLVTHSYRLMTLGERILGEKLLGVFVSPFYNQFVAGDSEEKLAATSQNLNEVNVKLMVAPMLETDIGENHDLEAMYQKNLDKTLFLVGLSSKHNQCDKSLPICQTKLTALLSADVLARVSTAYLSLNEEKRTEVVGALAQLLEASGGSSPQGTGGGGGGGMPSSAQSGDMSSLDILGIAEDDRRQLLEALPRCYKIGDKCVKDSVILAVDAEYTYTNPAINLLTLAMMKVFNTQKTIIWNTYQGYLKAGRENLEHDLRIARALDNFRFGVKIVRGAYLDRERSFAKEQNYPDPVNDTYEDTSAVYNSMVDVMLREVRQEGEKRAVIVASHNEESVKLAAKKIEDLGLDPQRGNVVFGQVYGMAENITVPLAHSGFMVYKSIPYGSMSEVMPYLSRRASENRAVFHGARKERGLLIQEIRSRMPFFR